MCKLWQFFYKVRRVAVEKRKNGRRVKTTFGNISDSSMDMDMKEAVGSSTGGPTIFINQQVT
jgi:hypothetical protein